MTTHTETAQAPALWGGRFSTPLAEVAHRFSCSIRVDGKLFSEDIAGSLAHVRMLGTQGVIGLDEVEAIVGGLSTIHDEIATGEFILDERFEDVHMAIESRLKELVGAVGGKLHTGRSRNDQVALDERLYMRSAIDDLTSRVRALQSSLLRKAEEHFGALMPGYTHMQRAQPVLLSHHLLAYVAMLERDADRLAECRARVNVSPLGAAAFAGTSYPIDRNAVASDLGFDGIVMNSIDAVSDRDHLIELASNCAIAMMHLSRLAEELVLWATKEFGFVTMSDAVTTGSSIMPQKKNPDMAELVRGKTGRVYGSLVNLLTIMKGLPLAYNRDMQEDKEPLFAAVETTSSSLEIMAHVIHETTFNTERMEQELQKDLLTATEIADYLAKKGLPFREAHHITGAIVARAVREKRALTEFSLSELASYSELFEQDIYSYLEPRRSVEMKQTEGSTSPSSVEQQILRWKEHLAS